jgi:murein DD-endopeptidase MepM/ murein hydrolase activator NlpD
LESNIPLEKLEQPTHTLPTAIAAIQPIATLSPSALVPTNTPINTDTIGDTLTTIPSPTTETRSDFAPCESEMCVQRGHFWFSSPIDPSGNDQIDDTYRYGSTQKAMRIIHHGVEMKNALATPVLAAASGTVIVAGDDKQVAYGPETDFYGNLIIIQHDFKQEGKPVFTLYAHLSKVIAYPGQKVKEGETIGLVGMTGIAIGYHLHFEVRVGENTYQNTRNPELWLIPHKDTQGIPEGAFAGRLVDKNGNPVRVAKVVLTRLDDPTATLPLYLDTYEDPPIPHEFGSQDDSFIMPFTTTTFGRDDFWREDFALSNLPAGKYRLSFTGGRVYQTDFEIHPSQITLLKIQVGQ